MCAGSGLYARSVVWSSGRGRVHSRAISLGQHGAVCWRGAVEGSRRMNSALHGCGHEVPGGTGAGIIGVVIPCPGLAMNPVPARDFVVAASSPGLQSGVVRSGTTPSARQGADRNALTTDD